MSVMPFIKLKNRHREALKACWRLTGNLLFKCWRQVLILLVIVIILYVALGFWLATTLLAAGIVAFVYKLTDWFLYHPDEPPHSRFFVCSPSFVHLPFKSLFIKTADDVEINAVFIHQDAPQMELAPTIVYFHGNAGNIGHRLSNVRDLYHFLKCNILLVEYRGYGFSHGSPSESGLYADGEAAVNYLIRETSVNKSRIYIFGRSLGGAVAVHLASRSCVSDKIAGIIVENTFTNIPDVARILFNFRIVRLLPNWFFKCQYNSIEKIRDIKVPILFLSGLADELIPSFMMRRLHDQCPSSSLKIFHTFKDGTHNFTWQIDGYYPAIGDFIEKVESRPIGDKCISKSSTSESLAPLIDGLEEIICNVEYENPS